MIKFLNPALYYKDPSQTDIRCKFKKPLGEPATERRYFDRTFVDFLGQKEVRKLRDWLDDLIEDYERDIHDQRLKKTDAHPPGNNRQENQHQTQLETHRVQETNPQGFLG